MPARPVVSIAVRDILFCFCGDEFESVKVNGVSRENKDTKGVMKATKQFSTHRHALGHSFKTGQTCLTKQMHERSRNALRKFQPRFELQVMTTQTAQPDISLVELRMQMRFLSHSFRSHVATNVVIWM